MRMIDNVNKLADKALTRILGETTAKAGCPFECGAWGSCIRSTAHCSGGWHRNRTCVNSACDTFTQVGCC